ncbi:MAG: hypothetical protein ACI9BN_001506, partial [Francisella sp.]
AIVAVFSSADFEIPSAENIIFIKCLEELDY